MTFDDAWADAVRRWCDPVFDAADCGFEWNGSAHDKADDGQSTSLLWEAVPQRFAERYPDSGIVEQWGGEEHGRHRASTTGSTSIRGPAPPSSPSRAGITGPAR